jgi:hypothetical protein
MPTIRPLGETRVLVSVKRMRRRAVGEQLLAAAKHDRHREEADRVDQVVGER